MAADAHQVLCISHLPQVAALADTQYVVTKEFTKDRTLSRLEKVEGKEVLRDSLRIGDQFPAHAGASGKVLLAYLPAEESSNYLKPAHALKALTPRTISRSRRSPSGGTQASAIYAPTRAGAIAPTSTGS